MATVIRRRSRSLRPHVGSGVFALLIWSGGHATLLQAQASLDAGGLAVRYDGVSSLGGVQLGPSFRRAGMRSYLELDGTGARFEDASWSASGNLLAAWRPGSFGPVTPELVAFGGLSGAKGSDLSHSAGGTARLHREVGRLDLYAGGGMTRSTGVLGARTVATAEVGAVLGDEARQASLTLGPVRGDGVSYTDATLYLHRAGRVTFDASGGIRAITRPVSERHGWIAASAEVGVGGALTLVATAGSFPGDPAQGFPGGRFLAVGIRWGRNPRPSLRSGGAAPVSRPLPWPEATFEVSGAGDGEREIRLTAPGATTVELVGDFTDWRPVPLVKDGTRWRLRVPLARGVHHLNIRLDGGAWLVPPGLEHEPDGFGGESGLLVVD